MTDQNAGDYSTHSRQKITIYLNKSVAYSVSLSIVVHFCHCIYGVFNVHKCTPQSRTHTSRSQTKKTYLTRRSNAPTSHRVNIFHTHYIISAQSIAPQHLHVSIYIYAMQIHAPAILITAISPLLVWSSPITHTLYTDKVKHTEEIWFMLNSGHFTAAAAEGSQIVMDFLKNSPRFVASNKPQRQYCSHAY